MDRLCVNWGDETTWKVDIYPVMKRILSINTSIFQQ